VVDWMSKNKRDDDDDDDDGGIFAGSLQHIDTWRFYEGFLKNNG